MNRSKEEALAQLKAHGIEGVGFICLFPHIAKVFFFGHNETCWETNLYVWPSAGIRSSLSPYSTVRVWRSPARGRWTLPPRSFLPGESVNGSRSTRMSSSSPRSAHSRIIEN